MSLLKQACNVNDGRLKAQILEIIALKQIANKNKKIKESMVIMASAMNSEQQAYWQQIEEGMLRIFRNLAYRKTSNRDLQEDLIQEAVLAVMQIIADNSEQYNLSDRGDREKFLKYLITVGKNKMIDKLSGARHGAESEEEYPTSYSMGVPKKVVHNPLKSIKEYLDLQLLDLGFSSPAAASVAQLDAVIEAHFPELERLLEEERKRREEKSLGAAPTLDKVLWRYKTRLEQERNRLFSGFSSLDQPFMEGEESAADTVGDKAEDAGNLFSLLGFTPFARPEDVVIQNEMLNKILPLIYKMPLVYRIIMAVHYGIDPNLLQRRNELDQEVERIAALIGMGAEDFLSALKTKGGKRLAWSSVRKLMEQAYGMDIVGRLKRVEDFEDYIKNVFSLLVEQEAVV